MAKTKVQPRDVARYFMLRAVNDGELISPLKMQKLVYYAYVWYLINKRKKLFDEKIEAWPNGPVIPSLYDNLKIYGSAPIGQDFINFRNEKERDKFLSNLPKNAIEVLDEVYDKYQTMSAFELVMLTHQERPWQEARKGLKPEERSNNPILDKNILEQYVS